MNDTNLISSPFSVAGLSLPNRIVLPPLATWRSDKTGEVNREHQEHYARSVGPGLMIVEATCISPEGRLASTQLGIWSDSHVKGLAELAGIIHGSGAMAGIQIHHAGGRATLEHTYGEQPLVPSVTDDSPDGAREMTEADIRRLVDAFGAATERAVKAGFDYVELHGAHGYLVSQFLSPLRNLRTDQWGGSLRNRRRFVLESYRRACEAAAGHAVVAVRLGLADAAPGGLSPEEGLEVATELAGLGCPVLDVSRGAGDPIGIVPPGSPFSATMHLAGMVKAAVPAVVIGVGDIRTPNQAEAVLQAGLADLVAVGRASLADPSWALKATGELEEPIEQCSDCKPRCFHFREPHKCPARRKLAARGACPAPSPLS